MVLPTRVRSKLFVAVYQCHGAELRTWGRLLVSEAVLQEEGVCSCLGALVACYVSYM